MDDICAPNWKEKKMVDPSRAAPVAALIELGEPALTQEHAWPDYRVLGLGAEHIPALIEIATDHALIAMTDVSQPSAWAPVHAWRALGQLRAVEAIKPLMALFHEVHDNDWVIEEMPDVFALIGPPAFPALVDYLNNTGFPVYSRLVAAASLMQIALREPLLRDPAVEAIAGQLSGYYDNSPGMNGVLIAHLVELDAYEKAELIHSVFTACKVDRFITGDWRDVRLRLRRAQEQSNTAHNQRPEFNLGSASHSFFKL
jgi:hypothetical protein